MTTPQETPPVNEEEQVETNVTTPEEPIIPPIILIAVFVAGLIFALGIYFVQPTFGALGYGSLAVSAIALVVWVLMNPTAASELLRGRGITFGGPAVLVTVVLMIVGILIYQAADNFNLQADLSASDLYSLNEDIEEILGEIADDPTVPSVQFTAFFNAIGAAERDRVEILFEQMQDASDGKIQYEFVNPDREPQRIQQQFGGNVQQGSVSVAPIDSETGEPDFEQGEILPVTDQYNLVNTLISVTATGSFRAIFLNVENGALPGNTDQFGASIFTGRLTDLYNWQIEVVDPLRLAADEPPITLNDPAFDGEVLVVPGGMQPLPDEVIDVLDEYIQQGGDLIVMATLDSRDNEALATAENMENFLLSNYGVRVRNDLVFDPEGNTQFGLLLGNFQNHPITESIPEGVGVLLFDAHSVEITSSLPDDVTASAVLNTSASGYAKAGLDLTQQLTQQDIARTPDDLSGPFPVVVAAENTALDARIVVMGSESPMMNNFQQLGNQVANEQFVRQAFFWTTNFDDFTGTITQIAQSGGNPQDAPIFIDPASARIFGFVSLFVLPFGLLAIGLTIFGLRNNG